MATEDKKEKEKAGNFSVQSQVKKLQQMTCSSFACFGKCPKDQAINLVLLMLLLVISAVSGYGFYSLWEIKKEPLAEKQEEVEVVEVPESDMEASVLAYPAFDVADWRTYRSNWYGFELKMPTDWRGPSSQSAQRGYRWERRYSFRKAKIAEEDRYDGFDVYIYNAKVIDELSKTDQYPLLKSGEIWEEGPEAVQACAEAKVRPFGGGNAPVKEIYVSANNNCFEQAFFFSLARKEFIYNIVPSLREGFEPAAKPREDIKENLPEFFTLARSIEAKKIIRPTAADIARAKAPLPVSYKWENGRRVCAKKNDKPRKSKQGKGKHMDMECCLDPDEYPNPHCYYDPKKYGKYLNNKPD